MKYDILFVLLMALVLFIAFTITGCASKTTHNKAEAPNLILLASTPYTKDIK